MWHWIESRVPYRIFPDMTLPCRVAQNQWRILWLILQDNMFSFICTFSASVTSNGGKGTEGWEGSINVICILNASITITIKNQASWWKSDLTKIWDDCKLSTQLNIFLFVNEGIWECGNFYDIFFSTSFTVCFSCYFSQIFNLIDNKLNWRWFEHGPICRSGS